MSSQMIRTSGVKAERTNLSTDKVFKTLWKRPAVGLHPEVSPETSPQCYFVESTVPPCIFRRQERMKGQTVNQGNPFKVIF